MKVNDPIQGILFSAKPHLDVKRERYLQDSNRPLIHL
jgi:hypothetical protein